MGDLRFFNPYGNIRFTANRLPHWQQEGAVYLVTFRLADAVPHRLRAEWQSEREAWLRVHPEPWSAKTEREYAVFVQNVAWPLEKIILSWKGFTARRINALLGRTGGFWQRDYLILSFAMANISRTAFATSGGIRFRQVCTMGTPSYMRVRLPERLSSY